LAARAALSALLEAYLGRRSAARVQTGAVGRGAGETIRAALLYADLCGFTAMSEATEPAVVITALDAWFDRIAGAVHAFGGEVLKFIGDGVLAIFPVTETHAMRPCARSPPPAPAWLISMLSVLRGDSRRCRSAWRCISAKSCGAISAPPTGSISPPSAPRSISSAGSRDCAGRSAADR
jgi:class 3 adenylate cyclase